MKKVLIFILLVFTTGAFAKKTGKKPAKKKGTVKATKGLTKGKNTQKGSNSKNSGINLQEIQQLKDRVKALQKKIEDLQSKQEEFEIQQMKTAAKIEAIEPKKEGFELKTFHGHGRSLQGLNPEISVVGDAAGKFVWSDGHEYTDDERSGFVFRTLGVHFQSDLDPFSYMKAAIEFSPEGVELGEAYIVWTNVMNAFDITLGKFRQQLGVVNRWHKHGLDQYDFPLMLKEPFGEGGLNQVGVSFCFCFPRLLPRPTPLRSRSQTV